jgi:hypothetical protein
MIAALGPPGKVRWVAALDAGPDDRPIREQLVEHGEVMSTYFEKLHAGLAVLHAAGITRPEGFSRPQGEPPPVQAFRALNRVAAARAEPGTPGQVRCRDVGRDDPWGAAQLGVHRARPAPNRRRRRPPSAIAS